MSLSWRMSNNNSRKEKKYDSDDAGQDLGLKRPVGVWWRLIKFAGAQSRGWVIVRLCWYRAPGPLETVEGP